MSPSASRVGGLVLAALLALAALVLFLLPEPGGPERLPELDPPIAPASTPARPVSATAASPELGAAIDAFLGGVKVDPATPTGQLVREARGATKDPLAYRDALSRVMRERADGPSEAAKELVEAMEAADETLLFQHALALSERLDAAATDRLLAGLTTAGPRARPHVAFALRGSKEPRVHDALVTAYGGDASPAVRAKAGFVLGERGTDLDPATLARARQVARADLRGQEPDLIDAAADVIGVPPLDERDTRMLFDTLAGDPLPRRREAALRALIAGRAPPAELLPALERLSQDAGAGRLQELAREALRPGSGE